MQLAARCDKSVVLEQFVLLARSAGGAAAAQLVRQALAAPGLHVFSELLDMPNIKQLAENDDYRGIYNLLELFTYHVYSDYVRRSSELPQLTAAETLKLRHLSIVTMATNCKSILYSDLMKELAIEDTRQLEDTIISAIYAGCVGGRLDPLAGRLEVQYVSGRDVPAHQLRAVCDTLSTWQRSCQTVVSQLSRQLQLANETKDSAAKQRANIDEQVAALRKSVRSQEQDDSLLGTDLISPCADRSKKLKMKSAKASSSSSCTGSAGGTSRLWKF